MHPPPRGVADLAGVEVRRERVRFPTYEPATPDRNPMFLEKRVYQGSNGKVYPLPMIDRIADKPVSRAWDVIWIENAYLKVMVLPAIGGRIHALVDKTTGHDLIYRQEVIKPALVGLAGPWLSGGIEFNWPQHHRPATFMPTDVEVEALPDGGKIVWCGDHDPLERMKGMHGVCLRPGSACLELRVRVHNRTPHVRTFLWWANVATRVHEAYRSFFPPDVRFVADHARRSMSRYPRCDGKYYGVDYGNRGREGVPVSEIPRRFVPPHVKSGTGPRVAGGSRREDADLPAYSADDLSYYANIPVPTSYMCLGSRGGFFGGYDYRLRTGIVHVADRFISPGKKQWTWGNHEFGYAWDGNLTDPGNDGVPAPYIELMAGVYTDNQPDFSFLGPGETRTWTQRWYPIHRLGPVDEANADAAVCLSRSAQGWRVGVEATRRFPKAKIVFVADGTRRVWRRDLEPGRPFVVEVRGRAAARSAEILVDDSEDSRIVAFRSRAEPTEDTVPPPASEPEAPREMASVDRLYLTGLHLAQYRHATRCPTLYWKEALRRDSGDSRCNTAMGVWHMARGEFRIAEGFLRRAIQRISERNSNPYDGEAHYQLGLCLRYQGMDEAAYEALAKATWNQAWRAAASVALAEIDCRRRAWAGAREHLERALTLDSGNLRARNLLAMVHRVSGSVDQGGRLVRETLAMDRLDAWARVLSGRTVRADLQTRLDVAHDLATAGFLGEAIGWLTASLPGDENRDPRNLGAWPMVGYTLAWLYERRGDAAAA
ncbi:MAG: DUF5107 domain-containing protein, partial [Verrucomicrobiales bacterium]|nr:DUF5107 domain-containing protein [Verrucomicrobiales bacterium]